MSRFIQRALLHPRLLVLGALAAAISPVPALGQSASYSIDGTRSLVWWQIDPHFGHLWATTCPKDASWQPGEGHSGRYSINYKSRPKYRLTKESEIRVPLFPRDTVRANCGRAVSGTFATTDVRRFAGFKGAVKVLSDSIINGSDVRDNFAYKYIYSTAKYPTINFVIDSVTSVAFSGDTVNAIAVGILGARSGMVTVSEFRNALLMFSPWYSTMPMCIQKRVKGVLPVKCCAWAISHSWCG